MNILRREVHAYIYYIPLHSFPFRWTMLVLFHNVDGVITQMNILDNAHNTFRTHMVNNLTFSDGSEHSEHSEDNLI